MAMSVVRVERIGPTRSASLDCQTQANRVMPPSTCSSKQMSALVSPDWGRATGSRLSIFTTSAGRLSLPASAGGRPVRGDTGGVVVVVGSTVVLVVVVASVVEGAAGAATFFLAPPEQATRAAASADATTVTRRRRATPGWRPSERVMTGLGLYGRGTRGSELAERFDALVERPVGLKELDEPAQPPNGGSRNGRAEPEMADRRGARREAGAGALHGLERADQGGGVAGQRDPGQVGDRLPLAPDRHLETETGEGGERQEDPTDDGACPSTRGVARRRREDPEEDDGERGGQDVVALDVAELMGEHRLELDAAEAVEQAGGHHEAGVARCATHGQRVQSRVVDHVEPRRRDAGAGAQALDEVDQPGVAHGVGSFRPDEVPRKRLTAPPGGGGHGEADHDGDDHGTEHGEKQQADQPDKETAEPACGRHEHRGQTTVALDALGQAAVTGDHLAVVVRRDSVTGAAMLRVGGARTASPQPWDGTNLSPAVGRPAPFPVDRKPSARTAPHSAQRDDPSRIRPPGILPMRPAAPAGGCPRARGRPLRPGQPRRRAG